MAVKILIPGNSPKYLVECCVCGCKFTCEHQDTVNGKDKEHRDALCPTCDTVITFNVIDARISERFEDMKRWEESLHDECGEA